MSVIELATALCPYCGRTIQVVKGQFRPHSTVQGRPGDTCPMTREHVPITGYDDESYARRADLIGHLAWRMKDEDPAQIWTYLTALPAAEMQRLLMIALAAIPTDSPISDLFDWIYRLPVAREEFA